MSHGCSHGEEALGRGAHPGSQFPLHLMGSNSSEFFPPGWLNLGRWSDEHPCGHLFNGNNDADRTR